MRWPRLSDEPIGDEPTGTWRGLSWRFLAALPTLLLGAAALRAGGRRFAEDPGGIAVAVTLAGIGVAALAAGGVLLASELNDLLASRLADLVWGGSKARGRPGSGAAGSPRPPPRAGAGCPQARRRRGAGAHEPPLHVDGAAPPPR